MQTEISVAVVVLLHACGGSVEESCVVAERDAQQCRERYQTLAKPGAGFPVMVTEGACSGQRLCFAECYLQAGCETLARITEAKASASRDPRPAAVGEYYECLNSCGDMVWEAPE